MDFLDFHDLVLTFSATDKSTDKNQGFEPQHCWDSTVGPLNKAL